MMPLSQWAALPPYQRDAIRIGFIGYTPPEGAGRWPETEFGWGILLNRFANERRIEELWTTGPAPITIAEQTARGAYEHWKRGGKIFAHTSEKVLTGVKRQRKRIITRATETIIALVKWSLGCFAFSSGSEAPAGPV